MKDFEIEKALNDAWNDWRANSDNIFDFVFPCNATLEIKPASVRARHDSYPDQSTGYCYYATNRICLSYGTDKNEALHVLLHEMCHCNKKSEGHDKVFNKSMAHATHKITGVWLDYYKPTAKLDREVAVAFGSTARMDAVAQRAAHKEKNKKIYAEYHKEQITKFNAGDKVIVNLIEKGYTYPIGVYGIILDINYDSCRCHVRVSNTGEVISRKVNKIYKCA